MDLIKTLLPCLQQDDISFLLEERRNHALGIELLDLIKIKCYFHCCRSCEHKQVALSIRGNTDT